METINRVVDSFFDFILRYFFGRIVPGFLFLSILLKYGYSAFDIDKNLISLPSGVLFLILLSLSWVAGFILQSLGEMTHLFKYFPKGYSHEKGHELRIKFLACATEDEKKQLELFIVIKESCGLSAIGILFSSIIVVLFKFATIVKNTGSILAPFQELSVNNIFILLLSGLSVTTLLHMHYQHIRRQYSFLKSTLDAHNI